MEKERNWGNLFGLLTTKQKVELPVGIKKETDKPLPAGRSSANTEPSNDYTLLRAQTKMVKPGYQFQVIPFIRNLTKVNPDVSQALHNIVHLGNTGHIVKFDASVPAEKVQLMRKHLKSAVKRWVDSCPNEDALANKIFRQVMIAGASSLEAVPNNTLTGINTVLFVKPEEIRFLYNKATLRHEPYQVDPTAIFTVDIVSSQLIKLNQETYKYFALNGDTESPYGEPPYLPSLGPIEDQKVMLKNIQFIIRQIGLMGFMELVIAKPDQKDGESDINYLSRMDKFIQDAKERVEKSMIEGVVVGFQDEHEFKFQSATKNLSGVETLFGINETQVSSGLKSDPGLMGKGSKGAESHITIIFTKILAELKNIQSVVGANLHFLYEFELQLMGFDFKSFEVIFKPSTILDDLKLAQAKEIKIRNLDTLYWAGIISQETYAEEMDREKPDQVKPRLDKAAQAIKGGTLQDQAVKKKKREDGKNASDRKVRAKNSPQDKKAGK